MCDSSGLFFFANSSLHARQNNLLLRTVNSSFGYAKTRSLGDMVLGSPFSFPFPRLVPFGGGFGSNHLLQAKTEGVGECNLSSKDETVEASDRTPSEVPISKLEWPSDSEPLATTSSRLAIRLVSTVGLVAIFTGKHFLTVRFLLECVNIELSLRAMRVLAGAEQSCFISRIDSPFC